MHKRPIRKDAAATRAAGYWSRYSYVSLRVHPGTTHQCEYLSGADCSDRRRVVFDRDHWRCVDCGSESALELDHMGGNTKVTRCWCMEALQTRCNSCHRRRHGREVRLGGAAT